MEEAGAAGKDAADEDFDEECIDFDPYAFIKNLPPLKQVVPRWRRSLLPRQTRQCKRKTLVSGVISLHRPEPLLSGSLESRMTSQEWALWHGAVPCLACPSFLEQRGSQWQGVVCTAH